jgi:hypothetical protein
VYVGSDGQRYAPAELVERFGEGEWRTCMRDESDGRQLVETGDDELLLIVPYRSLDDRGAVRDRFDRP